MPASRTIRRVLPAAGGMAVLDALSKNRILELYLNVAELGPMVHGVSHASRYYFGKAPVDLSLRESAFLAAMLPGPRISTRTGISRGWSAARTESCAAAR